MDNVNDLANELQAADIILSHFSVRRLEDFNTRSVSVGVFWSLVGVLLQTKLIFLIRIQELCESRGGRPGLSVLTSLMVSVDVKQH